MLKGGKIMLLTAWTPLIYSRKGFKKDEEGKAYIPKETFLEAFSSAVIFYYIKKDKEIENKVKKFLMSERIKIDTLVEEVKKIIFEKHPILEGLKLPEKVYLPQEKIKQVKVDVLDLKTKRITESFQTEAFIGSVEVPIESPYLEKLKYACHSYAEGLAHMEKHLLGNHPLAETFYNELLNEIKNWEIPLRLGLWTEVKFKGNLLFFWRIKEVRAHIKKLLKVDIRPRFILFLKEENQTCGWCQLS